MRRRRLPGLSEVEMTNLDDYEAMQSGTWNKGAGLPPRGHGTGEGLSMFGGIADQCGTCHKRMDECEWQIAAHEIYVVLPKPDWGAAFTRLGPHPR